MAKNNPPAPAPSNDRPDVGEREARFATDKEISATAIGDEQLPVVPLDGSKSPTPVSLEEFIGRKDPFFQATFLLSDNKKVRADQVASLRFALAAFLKAYPGTAQLVGTAKSCPECPAQPKPTGKPKPDPNPQKPADRPRKAPKSPKPTK